MRLDAALASRGLARSRTQAARLIAGGYVRVGGTPVLKASHPVADDDVVTVDGVDHYVSRGAHKLIAALDAFEVDPAGRVVLDAGASTGGFTQVLLERGARHVLAVDVGTDQLDPLLRRDERVSDIPGVNLRYATAAQLAAAARVDERPSLVVGDLSFISLTQLLEPLLALATPGADLVLLVKPQFEVGRTGVREGIVRDATLRADAVAGVLWAAHDLGLRTAGLIESPIVGGAGNREYLVRFSRESGTHPTEWMDTVNELTGAARG